MKASDRIARKRKKLITPWLPLTVLFAVVLLFAKGGLAVPLVSDPLLLAPTMPTSDPYTGVITMTGRPGAEAFKNINQQFRQREYKSIVKQAKAFIAARPQTGLAYEVLGTALYLQGELDGAIRALVRAISFEPKQSGPYAKLGVIYMEKGKMDKAETILQKAIALNSGNRIAQQQLGLLYENRQDDAKAIAHYRKGLEGVKKTYLGVAVNLAQLLNKEHRYQECINALAPRLPLSSDAADAHIILANAYYRSNQFELAQTRFERVLELQPKSFEARLGIGMTLRKSGKTAESLAYLEKLLKDKPDWLPAVMEYGESLLTSDRLDDAVKQFEKGVKLGSNPVGVQKRLATYYLQRKRFDKAEAIYHALIKNQKADVSVYGLLSELMQSQGKHDQGLAVLKDGLKRYPNNTILQLRLGSYLAALQRYGEAVPVLKQALDHAPNEPMVLQALCLAQVKMGDTVGALTSAEKLYGLKPGNNNIAILYATRLQAGGQEEKAERIYRQALSLEPSNVIIKNNLANLLADRNNFQEAEKIAKDLNSQTEGKSGIFLDTWGWILFRQNRFGEAIKVLNDATGVSPKMAVIQFHLGMAMAASGDKKGARQALKTAISMDADAAWADDARKKLSEL